MPPAGVEAGGRAVVRAGVGAGVDAAEDTAGVDADVNADHGAADDVDEADVAWHGMTAPCFGGPEGAAERVAVQESQGVGAEVAARTSRPMPTRVARLGRAGPAVPLAPTLCLTLPWVAVAVVWKTV